MTIIKACGFYAKHIVKQRLAYLLNNMLIFVQILPFIIFCYFLTVLFSIHLYLVVFNIFIWNWVLTVNFSWSGNYSHKSKIIFQFLSHFCLELAQCQALTQCQALALHQLKSGDLKRSLWSSSSTPAEIWRSFDKDLLSSTILTIILFSDRYLVIIIPLITLQ